MRFIIFAPSYNENIGGIVVLHKLCHLLNSIGFESYLYPEFKEYKINLHRLGNVAKVLEKKIKNPFVKYKKNASFDTPVMSGHVCKEDVVVYSELIMGNPLGAKNVVRWLLHKPGYHSGEFCFGLNELMFKFDRGLVDDFVPYKSQLSETVLNILHIPREHYNTNNASLSRNLVAYSIRKGHGKMLDQHPDSAICIDGLSHEEVADVFKRSYRFISYDAYSAYSIFAVLCGCESIIVPDLGVSKEEWYPDPCKRYGLAYGVDNISEAKETAHLKLQYLESVEKDYKKLTSVFVKEVFNYFSLSDGDE